MSLHKVIKASGDNFNTLGAEITNILSDNEESALNIWLPDIHFVDGTSVEYFGSTLRLYPGGVLAWSRHTLLSVSNPYFDYKSYPSDSQTIELRFESYAYPVVFVTLQLRKPAVMFVENNGRENFKHNPMWNYDSSTAFEALAVFSPIRAFTTATVQLKVSRRSSGVVVRLVLPIVLLVLLSGFTFWAEKDTRTDSTITLLLAVSALYIVVFSNIPMLGYLTSLDKYISYIFILLTLCCFVHQSVMRMADKHIHWPLRAVYIRLLEAAGRMFVIPFTSMLFVAAFPATPAVRVAVLASVVGYVSFVGTREIGGLMKAFKRSMFGIRDKADHPTEHKFSSLEMLLFNLWFYGVLSRSLSVHIRYRAKAMRKLHMYEMSNINPAAASVRNQMSTDNKSDDDDRFSL